MSKEFKDALDYFRDIYSVLAEEYVAEAEGRVTDETLTTNMLDNLRDTASFLKDMMINRHLAKILPVFESRYKLVEPLEHEVHSDEGKKIFGDLEKDIVEGKGNPRSMAAALDEVTWCLAGMGVAHLSEVTPEIRNRVLVDLLLPEYSSYYDYFIAGLNDPVLSQLYENRQLYECINTEGTSFGNTVLQYIGRDSIWDFNTYLAGLGLPVERLCQVSEEEILRLIEGYKKANGSPLSEFLQGLRDRQSTKSSV